MPNYIVGQMMYTTNVVGHIEDCIFDSNGGRMYLINNEWHGEEILSPKALN